MTASVATGRRDEQSEKQLYGELMVYIEDLFLHARGCSRRVSKIVEDFMGAAERFPTSTATAQG